MGHRGSRRPSRPGIATRGVGPARHRSGGTAETLAGAASPAPAAPVAPPPRRALLLGRREPARALARPPGRVSLTCPTPARALARPRALTLRRGRPARGLTRRHGGVSVTCPTPARVLAQPRWALTLGRRKAARPLGLPRRGLTVTCRKAVPGLSRRSPARALARPCRGLTGGHSRPAVTSARLRAFAALRSGQPHPLVTLARPRPPAVQAARAGMAPRRLPSRRLAVLPSNCCGRRGGALAWGGTAASAPGQNAHPEPRPPEGESGPEAAPPEGGRAERGGAERTSPQPVS
jgi:hypothetical protein